MNPGGPPFSAVQPLSPRASRPWRLCLDHATMSSATGGGPKLAPTVPSPAVAEEEWLDPEGAAAYLGLPTRLVYAMVNAGQIPAWRFPLRIRRQDLENCLERCRIKPGDLAHLDPNATRRGGGRKAPLTARGTPDAGSVDEATWRRRARPLRSEPLTAYPPRPGGSCYDRGSRPAAVSSDLDDLCAGVGLGLGHAVHDREPESGQRTSCPPRTIKPEKALCRHSSGRPKADCIGYGQLLPDPSLVNTRDGLTSAPGAKLVCAAFFRRSSGETARLATRL